MGKYLIWSEEHGAWWNPNSAGYTMTMKRAGRYTRSEAHKIADSANGGGTFCEVPVLLSPDMEALCQRKSGGR